MKAANCYICGSQHHTVIDEQPFKDAYLDLIDPAYQQEVRRLVACDSCGFVYHSPLLEDADLDVLYARFRDSTIRGETPDEYFDRITSLPPEKSENSAKVAWLRRHLPEAVSGVGNLLDIGCGGGVFIHTFLKAFTGWDACGLEPTPAFAQLAARRLGRKVENGTYRPGLFGRRFDLMTVIQVLEHVSDPVAFLSGMHQDLAPGGNIYLEVPDLADFAHLEPEHDRFMMQHLWVFSEASLSNVCHRAGFSVLAMDHEVTVRTKRNLIVLLAADDSAKAKPLLRDPVDMVLGLRRSYHEARS